MISIKTIQKYDDSGRQFWIVIYFQSLESTKIFCLQ